MYDVNKSLESDGLKIKINIYELNKGLTMFITTKKEKNMRKIGKKQEKK